MFLNVIWLLQKMPSVTYILCSCGRSCIDLVLLGVFSSRLALNNRDFNKINVELECKTESRECIQFLCISILHVACIEVRQANSLKQQHGKQGVLVHGATVLIRDNRAIIKEFDDITTFITAPIIQY